MRQNTPKDFTSYEEAFSKALQAFRSEKTRIKKVPK
jgi:hypothetical protein